MKKLMAMLLALVMVMSLVACGGSSAPAATQAPAAEAPKAEAPAPEAPAASGEKITINVMSFTNEVPNMIYRYMELHPEFAEKYEVKDVQISTTDGLYEPALDEALAAGSCDIYMAEAAFVLKYTQGDMAEYAAPYEDIGIDISQVQSAEIAPYSVEIGTRPADGKLVGLGYQATGGAFIYRRSIAKDVWGTDDPAEIEKIIGAGSGNWDKFFEAAEALKGKGYAILSGDGDLWHAVENSSSKGWLEDDTLVLDPKREAFMDLSMKLMENDYHNDTRDWQDAWYADMKDAGAKKVFGWFGPAWLINYVMAGNSGGEKIGEGTYGDFAVCAPPVGFFWGGTWVLANKSVIGTEKAAGVAELINWITLDDSEDGLQYMWANGTLYGEGGTKDTVASGTVMAKSNGELDFLNGQNMFDAFVPANAYANGKNLTQYDQKINDLWRDQVRQYTGGSKTKDEAIASWKENVSTELGVDVG